MEFPSLVPKNEKRFDGIRLEIEKIERLIEVVNTVCSQLLSDIKNSFWDFLKKSVG